MIRFLSEILKKHTKLAKIVKISEIFNRLVFPLNFNRFCHPMTVQCVRNFVLVPFEMDKKLLVKWAHLKVKEKGVAWKFRSNSIFGTRILYKIN